MISDEALVRQYVWEGSQAAFAELVRRHVDAVYHTALRTTNGDSSLAQDATQEAFTALAVTLRTGKSIRLLAGWLHSTVRHKAGHAVEAESRRRARELKASVNELMSADQDPSLDWERLQPLIDDALECLSAADREIVLLRFFQQWPFGEIGYRFGISGDAARFRLERACGKMRRSLEKKGLQSTAAAFAGVLAANAHMPAPAEATADIANLAFAHAATVHTGTGVALLAAMSNTKFSLMIVAAAFSAGALLGTHEARRYVDAYNALARDRGRAALLENKLHDTAVPIAKPQRPSESTLASNVGQGADPSSPIERGNRLMATQPELRSSLTQALQNDLRLKYGPILARLSLSPDAFGEFLQIMSDATAPLSFAGRASYKFSIATGAPFSVPERNERLLNLLGTDGFQQFRNYERSYNSLEISGRVAAVAVEAGEALSPDQYDHLTQSISAVANGNSQPSHEEWVQVIKDATNYLDPGQALTLAADSYYIESLRSTK